MTNLMGDCTTSENNCDLGSIYFQTDFARTPTDCFGAGGYYEMSELDGLWVFFTMNLLLARSLWTL